MCLRPQTIPNPSKYISLSHRDRFMMEIPCGNCSECQTTLSNQWFYRAWYECDDLLSSGSGYVLFDTLTYNDEYLPHLSDYWTFLSTDLDYPCFDKFHIRRFLQLLRMRLIRAGFSKNAFRYFIASEYGTSDYYYKNGYLKRAQHRPHYHLLLYVYDSRIEPLYLSRLIAEIWKYGITDGVPYKSCKFVMENNVIKSDSLPSSKLRSCRYVTKYVQKSCKFQEELDFRINKVMWRIANYVVDGSDVTPNEWLQCEEARRERLKLMRFVNQFHRQSQHFGESALSCVDLNRLFEDGCLFMPDCDNVKIAVPLSTYYKRKLFYELVEFNGSKYWQLNDLGVEYYEHRRSINFERLLSRYECINEQFNLNLDCVGLVDYVLNWRGTIKADLPACRLQDKIDSIDLFNYSTSSDKLQFGKRFVSLYWCGDSQQGYLNGDESTFKKLSWFISNYCYFDKHFEEQLSKLYAYLGDINLKKQAAYKLRQHLVSVYNYIF